MFHDIIYILIQKLTSNPEASGSKSDLFIERAGTLSPFFMRFHASRAEPIYGYESKISP